MSKSYFLKFTSAFLILVAFAAIVYTNGTNLYASNSSEIVTTDFVDLEFKIDDRNYISKTERKSMDIAPIIENGRTLVPFRAIFEELGFDIKWDGSTRSITATRQGTEIKLQIDNKTAFVNGSSGQLDVAPTIQEDRTLVPLRFVAESSGAFVDWDGEERSISINRVGRFNTGTVLFYDQQGRNPQVYVYDGSSIATIPLEGKEIQNTTTYNGGLLITLFDEDDDTNNLVTFRNGKFETLINNFEIRQQVEFNDNLILHGYDRTQKNDALYRFDGEDIYKIADNFAMGDYVILNDQLIVNRYTDTRNYSLVVFKEDSWNPRLLRSDYILQDSMIDDDILFMSCTLATGTQKPFVSYDGKTLRLLDRDLDIDLEKTTHFVDNNGVNNIITVATKDRRDHLIVLKNSRSDSSNYKIYDLFVPQSVSERGTVRISEVEIYNGLIYMAINDNNSIITSTGFYSTRLPENINEDNTFTGGDYLVLQRVRTLYGNCNFQDLFVEDDKLIIHIQDRDSSDYMLYIWDEDKESVVRDVTEIISTKTIENNLFLSVKDIDRMSDDSRFALILYDADIDSANSRIRNLVLGMEKNIWEQLESSLAISGTEADINRSKVYLYSDEFEELLSNFEVNYWGKIDNKVFTSGRDTDSNITSFYNVSSNNSRLLRRNFNVENVIEVKGDYYIIYGRELSSDSPFRNTDILYIYNERTNEFVDIAVDIQLTDLIFIN
ncbi:copper amine oxidase N-terminal domain-containing protein [Herbivorax sp. ANBcel31]|uniref:copper amine oxidase N-terminal domain-containing protein n=1 Tax=Herbivorax sp. ANBcel31 TaxID=3069754 RepID=UPI0027B377B0|nr:copper amine oxidase N-terminal domain-containing protein [Herbivorax sp. ANBcel31]MDQ2085854.1 copper amine oxidase N-terminal domain-containing protein [Herbivorax sp. ANBcel31]